MLHKPKQKKTTQKLQLLGSQGRNLSRVDFVSFQSIARFFIVNNGKLRQRGMTMLVSKLLLEGREKLIQLGRLLGLNNSRELTQLTEWERKSGIFICASIGSDEAVLRWEGQNQMEGF